MLGWWLACGSDDRVGPAIDAGVAALSRATAADPRRRIDVPIGVAGIARAHPSAAASDLLSRLRAADDGGDPRRRAFDDSARLPAEAVHRWTPGPGVSPNRALVEALYCPEHGFRPEVAAWVCSELRDEGGYASAHAAWILALAVDRGCLRREETCLDAVRDELVDALGREEPLGTTAAVDLHAERILFGRMAGASPTALREPVQRLLAVQRPDGAFADPAEEWAATHATLAATWALALWSAPVP